MNWRLIVLAGSLLASANDWARLAGAPPSECHARTAAAHNLKAARSCLILGNAPRAARRELLAEWNRSGRPILRAARLAARRAA